MTKVHQQWGDGNGPRRFDPKQRGRDFTHARKRRKRGQTEQSTEKRIEQLETWSYLNTSVATQAASTTLIEVVSELPDCTYLDIGRQIILRASAALQDVLYVGMQLADDTVGWVQWTTFYEEPTTSPGFAWVKHFSNGTAHRAVFLTSTFLYYLRDAGDLRSYNLSTGAGLLEVLIPSSTNSGYGLYLEPISGSLLVWVSVPGTNKVEYYNGSSIVTSAATQNFWGLWFDAAGSRLLLTDRSNNRCTTMNKTTLAVVTNFATDCLTPEGIASDSLGNIYIADTGNNRMRKYNSALTLQFNWGTAGTADGQFNAPKGVAVDSSDRVYVCDSGNNRVQVFNSSGTFLGKFGTAGSGGGQFSGPNNITINGLNIVVNDFGNNRVSFWTHT